MEGSPVAIDHGGDAFFSDFISVFHNQHYFTMDFRQGTPRTEHIDNDIRRGMVFRHKAVVLTPIVAKELLRVLTAQVELYEKTFGEIAVPKPEKIADKKENKEATNTKYNKYIG